MIRHPALALLVADHQFGIALALRCRKQALGQVRPAGGDGLKARASELELFYTQNLIGHFRAEEDILFPRVAGLRPEMSELVRSLAAEHETIRRGVEALAQGDRPKALFDLGDLLDRHIRREERELFSFIADSLPPAEAENIKNAIARLAGPRPFDATL